MDIVAPPARWRSESQEIGSFYKFLKAEVEKLNAEEEDPMRMTNLILREYVSPNPYIQKMYFQHQRKKRLGDSEYPQAFRPSEPRLKFPSVWDSSVKPEQDTSTQDSRTARTDRTELGSRTESRAESDTISVLEPTGPPLHKVSSPEPIRHKLPEPEPISYRVPQTEANGGQPKSGFVARQQSIGNAASQGSGRPQSSSGAVQRTSFGRADSSGNGRLRNGNGNESGNGNGGGGGGVWSASGGNNEHSGGGGGGGGDRAQGIGIGSQSNNKSDGNGGGNGGRSVSPSRRLDRMNAFRQFSGDGEYENSGIFYKVDRSRSGGRFYG